MKKLFTSFAFIGLLGMAQGQDFYSFSQSTTTYTPLPTTANTITIIQTPAIFDLSISKNIMLYNERMANILTVGRDGFVLSQSPTHFFGIDPFVATLTFGSGQIKYEWDTLGSNQYLWFEWQDFQLDGHPNTDFVNFKLGINLLNQEIEFHYGSSQVTATSAFFTGTGPQVGVSLLSSDFFTTYYENRLTGDPASPTHQTTATNVGLSSVPADGTVYKFSPTNISISENDFVIKTYPNPASSHISIELGDNNRAHKAILYNMLGQTVLEQNIKSSSEVIDISHLPEGTYSLLISENGVDKGTQRITIVR